ncbi:hypothetical protein L5515_007311 [Caenorhabditis briggsae]|uniref:Uncharacterized protein n=1 Tax=Caenorhabditis briggsae TaxID=6238 RepID=A0AAE9JJA3_CAEBR|nr:hypothetical protein L5515_007311 [Caenorhabditis briggsae]
MRFDTESIKEMCKPSLFKILNFSIQRVSVEIYCIIFDSKASGGTNSKWLLRFESSEKCLSCVYHLSWKDVKIFREKCRAENKNPDDFEPADLIGLAPK